MFLKLAVVFALKNGFDLVLKMYEFSRIDPQFMVNAIILASIISSEFGSIHCSIGDQLSFYRKCLTTCHTTNCSSTYHLDDFKLNQPFHLQLMGWDCSEECKYQCQWDTVHYLMSSDVGVLWEDMPQFYGKVQFNGYLCF